MALNHLVIPSPIGPLTLFEDDWNLIAIEAGAAPTSGSLTPGLKEAKQQLDAYFDGKLKSFDLQIAPPGTPRQREIWEAMIAIPYGETRTYGELANTLDSAPRAIGGACAKNPLPIIIPCHRVLGSDGGVGFYSFAEGPETKKRLLTLEGAKL